MRPGRRPPRPVSGSSPPRILLHPLPRDFLQNAGPPVGALGFAIWDPLRSALVWTCLIGSVGWQSCISARWGLPSPSNQRPADALATRLQTPGQPPQALPHPGRDRCPTVNTVQATWTARTRLPLQAATPLLSSHTKPQLDLYWILPRGSTALLVWCWVLWWDRDGSGCPEWPPCFWWLGGPPYPCCPPRGRQVPPGQKRAGFRFGHKGRVWKLGFWHPALPTLPPCLGLGCAVDRSTAGAPLVTGLLRPLKQAVHQPPRRQGSGNHRPLKQADPQTPIAVLEQVLPLSLFLERRSVPLLVLFSQFLPARGYCLRLSPLRDLVNESPSGRQIRQDRRWIVDDMLGIFKYSPFFVRRKLALVNLRAFLM